MEGVRVRLAFEDRHILSKSLRKQGLKRCWILLKPHHGTISDITADLLHCFELKRTCPRGVILSMDGFVLPPFESTSILKDKDVVWVTKRGGSSDNKIKWDHGDNILEELEYVEKQPVNTTLKLLANEEFENEAGGYESESEDGKMSSMNEENVVTEDAASKKRKASKKTKSPKRKKRKFADVEESPVLLEGAVNDKPVNRKKNLQADRVLLEKSPLENDRSTSKQAKQDKLSTTTNDDGSVAIVPEGQSQSPTKIQGSADASPMPGKPKTPSRSARRKKAKRQWISEMRKIGSKPEAQKRQPLGNDDWRRKFLGNNDNTLLPKDDEALPSVDQRKSSEEQEQVHQSDNSTKEQQQPHNDCCDTDDVVPVVIKPGHIRFGPVDKVADLSVVKDQVQMNYQWNGITSKKKGQKWGKEKVASKWDTNEAPSVEPPVQEPAAEKEIHPSDNSDVMNFNKLPPYGPFPKEGEIIAYRVIELSPSWTPEISMFRVGRISSCKQGRKSHKVILVPVPEYPFDMEKIDKSLYKEDGSLEVDFSALVDVRSFNKEKSDAAQTVAVGQANETPAEDPNAAKWGGAENSEKDAAPATPPIKGNGQVNVWDEISEALSSKKAQLSQEDRWGKKESPSSGSGSGIVNGSGSGRGNGNGGGRGNRGRGSSSQRVARGSALGPIVALLRAQNGL